MQNQNQPPFPFDAFDPMDEFNAADIFPPLPSFSSGGERASIHVIRRKLEELESQLRALLQLLDRELAQSPSPARVAVDAIGGGAVPSKGAMPNPRTVAPATSDLHTEEGGAVRTLEGVFDGQNMVGPDGKRYSVPANYASKSKLVEGDILKLTITGRGAFVYKQIVPIQRDRAIGILERDDVTHEFVVIVADAEEDRAAFVRAVIDRADLPVVGHKRYRVLRASITFFRGRPGDEVVVLLPKGAPSTWAAVENIIKH